MEEAETRPMAPEVFEAVTKDPGTVTDLVETFERRVSRVAFDHNDVVDMAYREGTECGAICEDSHLAQIWGRQTEKDISICLSWWFKFPRSEEASTCSQNSIPGPHAPEFANLRGRRPSLQGLIPESFWGIV